MLKLVQRSPSSVLIAATFHQLALKPRFQWQWQMSEQWVHILIVEYCSMLAPILNELNGMELDKALKKDKAIKAHSFLTMLKEPTPLA